MDIKAVLTTVFAYLRNNALRFRIENTERIESAIDSVGEKVAKAVKNSRPDDISVKLSGVSVVSIKGDDGYTPTDEELLALIRPLIPDAIPGNDGHTPTEEELLSLIRPLIPKPKDGKTPTKSELLSLIKPLIPPKPKDGKTPTKSELESIIKPLIPKPKDGSPDTPEQIKEKLESLDGDDRLDAKAIKNLPKPVFGGGGGIRRIDAASDTRIISPSNGEVLKFNSSRQVWENGTVSGGSGHTIQDEGTPLTSRSNLNFVGAGVAVTDDAGNDATVVTINGGGSGGHTIKEAGSSLTQRTGLNFGSGFDLSDDSVNDETDVALDLSEVATGGDLSWSGNTPTVANGTITLAKQADMATASVVYRKTAGTGAPEVQTLATLKTDLGLTGTNSGDQTSIVGITGTKSQFNTAVTDGDFLFSGDITQYTDEMAQDAVGSMIDSSLSYVDGTPLLQRAALTGDVTASAGSNATTIANDVVSNAKLANMATQTIKGRTTAGTGDPEDLTASQAAAIVQGSIDHGSIAGLSDDDHTQYTKADGTRAFTAKVSYSAHPTFASDTEIVDKKYVDDAITAGGGYTDEQAQDAIGAMIADTATIDLTYTDLTPELKADVKDGSITYAKIQDISATDRLLGRDTTGAGDAEELTVSGGLEFTGSGGIQRSALTGAITASAGSNSTSLGSFTKAQLDTAVSDGNVMFDGDSITNATATAHRVFYSDGSGVITELALGADGTFLKSNGATAAPSFATPAGSGDVSKVGTPVNNQVGVWTGDGTLEGDTALTFDTTTDTLSVAASGKIAMGAVNIIDDSAGTTTLSNIDALDATTEATVEAAIDTLANLTSIQGRTVTLADAGANAIFGWDDTAGAYENLTQAEARTVLGLGTAAYVATDLSDLNEATIEGAIDTLANLTSIQGRTVTLADAGADAILGWDDSANAYQNLSAADAKTALSLVKGDVGLGNVDNTSDANKPVSTATQTALDLKANLASPTFTGTVTLPTTSVGGTMTLAENTSIALDPAGSADGKYSGITIAGTAGAALAFGDLVYLSAADSRWELADADAASTSGDVQLGMCVLAAAGDGSATTILLYGNIRADAAFPALTIGAPAYVSTTAGDIQVAQPSGTDDVIRRVGFALTADELMFNPSNDYITHV